ncbi:MAG: hypothetical protein ABI780_01450 [Ardenticatenales bacterium]
MPTAPAAPTADSPRVAPASASTRPSTLADERSAEDWRSLVPALATREAMWRIALGSGESIVPLAEGLSDAQRRAQAIALADERVAALGVDADTGARLRAEVMQVREVVPGDVSAATAACRDVPCMRVEVYAYATNATTVAFVDIAAKRVVDVAATADAQPDIPPHLAALAIEIARRSPEVQALLGFAPGADDAVMAGVKSALNGSRCERSRHLCVAPTFVVGDQALWAIVDLTDGRLVGTRWTDVGAAGIVLGAGGADEAAGGVAGGAVGEVAGGTTRGALVTEQGLEDEVVMATFCRAPTHVDRDGWAFDYLLTPSDGLELRDVQFNGRAVLRSAKLVDWHVSYSGRDGFGYSDAIGCPKFSSASVVAFNGPALADLGDGASGGVGFMVTQDFRSELWPGPCNYRYEQRFAFYRDGRFRVGGANLGRGCGTSGTYRPVLRIDITGGGDGTADRFEAWDGAAWNVVDREGWRGAGDDGPRTSEGYAFRVLGPGGAGWAVEPNDGQFGDGSRGDGGYVYATRHAAAEGDGDLLTIGPCCNSDEAQGPEKFMQPPEPIDNADIVLWFVAELHNSDAPGAQYCWVEPTVEDGLIVPKVFPCAFGPMFVPISAPEEAR